MMASHCLSVSVTRSMSPPERGERGNEKGEWTHVAMGDRLTLGLDVLGLVPGGDNHGARLCGLEFRQIAFIGKKRNGIGLCIFQRGHLLDNDSAFAHKFPAKALNDTRQSKKHDPLPLYR